MARDAAHWATYNESQGDRPPRPLCRDVLALAGPGEGRLAVDLGCGAGIETRAMRGAGWRVHAIDSEPSTVARLGREVGDDPDVEVVLARIDEVGLPAADLVHASYTLPYVDPQHFPGFWEGLVRSLRPGAWLAVDLFGEKDSWAGDEGISSVTRAELDGLLEGLDVVRLDEEDEDGTASSGPKHWHVFHVIAQRPAPDRA